MSARKNVVVVGGGLTGLAAAILARRRGAEVTLLEKASKPGGRARSEVEAEMVFNLGAHALYVGGEGWPILRELGIEPSGNGPSLGSAVALFRGRRHRLPVGLASLFATRLLGPRDKVELAHFMVRLGQLDTAPLQDVTLDSWAATELRRDPVRSLVHMLVRLSTFHDCPEAMSAGAALDQLQIANRGGVIYVDGGWQALVDGLVQQAEKAGVRIETGAQVEAIAHDGAVRGVVVNGERRGADAVIVTGSPDTARRLVPDGWRGRIGIASNAEPVRAACLDVALERLPSPETLLALGVDEPLYFSVHSASCRLDLRDRARDGSEPSPRALVHTMMYLGGRHDPPGEVRPRLESLLDGLQPGWREVCVHAQYLPQMTVQHARAEAAQGGLGGRPLVDALGIAGLLIAGDWVGPRGMLLDACLSSAKAAATMACSGTGARRAEPALHSPMAAAS